MKVIDVKTQYIAPMSLWLVVRKRFLDTGLFIEPAWVGSGEKWGPVVFVSRVLAESYANLRNKYHGPDDSDTWKVVALQDFDLLDHARGVDGPLYCMMAFGFSMRAVDSSGPDTGLRARETDGPATDPRAPLHRHRERVGWPHQKRHRVAHRFHQCAAGHR